MYISGQIAKVIGALEIIKQNLFFLPLFIFLVLQHFSFYRLLVLFLSLFSVAEIFLFSDHKIRSSVSLVICKP